MAVSIIPGSAVVHVTSRPSVGAPRISASAVAFPGGGWIRAKGRVQFQVAPGDSATNWYAGFIQAQWIETNWGYYRGQSNSDGSAFYQRARPPARPAQGCRDTVGPVSDVFYAAQAGYRAPIPAGPYMARRPVDVSAKFEDQPADSFPLSVTNNATHKPNYLAEAQLEFHFCTVFVVRDPSGKFYQLKHFFWNAHWQYRFNHRGFPAAAANTTIVPVPAGIGAHVSAVFNGSVTDRRFVNVLTSLRESTNCNGLAANEVSHPNIRTSATWEEFDVRR
jgi:hypothetical protein